MSTDAMDTEEGDAITKMILDKTKIKARQMQRRSRLVEGWDMDLDDVPRPLSVPLPNYANEDRAVGRDQLLPCHPLFSPIMRKSMMSS